MQYYSCSNSLTGIINNNNIKSINAIKTKTLVTTLWNYNGAKLSKDTSYSIKREVLLMSGSEPTNISKWHNSSLHTFSCLYAMYMFSM